MPVLSCLLYGMVSSPKSPWSSGKCVGLLNEKAGFEPDIYEPCMDKIKARNTSGVRNWVVIVTEQL